MQCWSLQVTLDHRIDEAPDAAGQRRLIAAHALQHRPERRHALVEVTPDQRDQHRILVGVVLVQRSDRDARRAQAMRLVVPAA